MKSVKTGLSRVRGWRRKQKGKGEEKEEAIKQVSDEPEKPMEPADEETAEKINALNEIFEEVISDASDLIKDLYWGVKTYLLFGLMTILFGVSELLYTADSFQEQLYIPVFIAAALIFSGSAQIINYFRLNKKYGRLFRAQKDLRNS